MANGIAGVKTGESIWSSLWAPMATPRLRTGISHPSDGSMNPNGVICGSSTGFLTGKSFYAKLATQLAQQTNSIVVAPNLPPFPFLCSDCSLSGTSSQRQPRTFVPRRSGRVDSERPRNGMGRRCRAVRLGRTFGGRRVRGRGRRATVDNGAADEGTLLGVVMFDGVSTNDTWRRRAEARHFGYPRSIRSRHRPRCGTSSGQRRINSSRFDPTNSTESRALAEGSHVDSMMGTNRLFDSIRATGHPPFLGGNTAATYTLSTGWINDMYAARASRTTNTASTPQSGQRDRHGRRDPPVSLAGTFASAAPTKTNESRGQSR